METTLTQQLQSVLEERATVNDEMRTLLEEAGSAGLSEAAAGEYDRREKRFEELNGAKERLEGQIARDRAVAGGSNSPEANGVTGQGEGNARAAALKSQEDAFRTYLRNGETGISGDTRAILRDHNASREERDMVVGTPSDGGYFAPPTFEKGFLEKLVVYGAVRKTSIQTITTADGRELDFTVVTARGEASLVAEATEVEASDDTLGNAKVNSYAMAKLMRASKELVNDSTYPIDEFVQTSLARMIGLKEDYYLMKGSGVDEPQGMLTGCTQVVDAAAAAAVSLDDLLEVVFTLTDPYADGAQWITRRASVGKLRGIKDTVGQYLWQPSIVAGTPDMLLGYPVFTDPFIDAIGANNSSFLFGNFEHGGLLRQVNGVEVQRLVERYAEFRKIGFIGDHRIDSRVIDENALVKLTHPAA